MPKISLTYTSREVALVLRDKGIEVLGFSEMNYEQDGEVKLKNDLHIQVGAGYLVLSKENYKMGHLENIEELLMTSHLNEIITKLQELLDKSGSRL